MQRRTGALAAIVFIFQVCCFIVPTELWGSQKYNQHDDLLGVCFPTESHGWVCGRWGTILHTRDGGRSWTRQNSNVRFTLADITFVDEKTGWAVGNNGTIVHTADGGNKWEIQKSPVSYFHMGVTFVDRHTGWVASDRTHILHTVDGGKTWEIQFSDVVYRLKSISFADPLHGWAVGEYGYTYYTKDGGENWEHQAGYMRYNPETYELEGGLILFDVLAIDPQTAVASGIDGWITRTTDGGKTWYQIDANAPQRPLFSVSAVNSGSLVVAGKGVCLFSQDNGKTWQQQKFTPPITFGWLYRVVSLGPSKKLAAVGLEGGIYIGQLGSTLKRAAY